MTAVPFRASAAGRYGVMLGRSVAESPTAPGAPPLQSGSVGRCSCAPASEDDHAGDHAK